MPVNNYLWSRCDDAIQRPDLARIAPRTEDEKNSSQSSRTSEKRLFSSSSSSSVSSSFSALSDFPLMPKHGTVKVPLHVAASLAHRGFDVDDIGRVTWRDNSPSHPRNWSTLRKLYDVSMRHELTPRLGCAVLSTCAIGCCDRLSRDVHNASQQYGLVDSSGRSCRPRRKQRDSVGLFHDHVSFGAGSGRTGTASYCGNIWRTYVVHFWCCGFHAWMRVNGSQSDLACGNCRSDYLWIHECVAGYGGCQQL